MLSKQETTSNVKEAVPYFMVEDMNRSLNFYVDGLQFDLKDKWDPHGNIAWCSLQIGEASIMLQSSQQGLPTGKLGVGVSVYFICDNALKIYKAMLSKGLSPREPFVGNAMWVVSIEDPDGYELHFESPTDVPEETRYSEWRTAR